jgi:hypothetical protein
MFDEVHGKRVECRALNIPEELGQVQYMFCDKAGLPTFADCHKSLLKNSWVEISEQIYIRWTVSNDVLGL